MTFIRNFISNVKTNLLILLLKKIIKKKKEEKEAGLIKKILKLFIKDCVSLLEFNNS